MNALAVLFINLTGIVVTTYIALAEMSRPDINHQSIMTWQLATLNITTCHRN